MGLQVGTPANAAPEIVNAKRYSGQAVDVWGLGIVLFCMVCGRHPFYTRNHNEMLRRIIRTEFK